MTFEQLHYFLEIVKDMNFTRAASRLFISQSTLSRQIAALESALGARLLIRDTRSVELTEAGKLLAREGVELFQKKTEIEDKIWRLSEGISGKINLVSLTMQSNEVYEICHRFQVRYPNIALNLTAQVHGTTVEQLEQGFADVGVGISCELENAPDNLETVPIKHDKFYVIVPEYHRLAGRTSVTREEMKGEHILVAREPIASRLCVEIHNALGVGVKNRRGKSQPNTLAEMIMQVKAGIGAAILPGVLCRPGEGYHVLSLEDVETDFDVVMIWKKESSDPSMVCFKQVVQECLAEMGRMT